MFGRMKACSAAGLVVSTCDPSNRLRDAVEHIDKDLSALLFGLWCFIWRWLICRCFFQDLKGRSFIWGGVGGGVADVMIEREKEGRC